MRLQDIERALANRPDEAHLSSLALDRAADGERTGTAAHLASCARCAERLQAIVAARTAFLRENWVSGTTQRIVSAARTSRAPATPRRVALQRISRVAAFAAIAASFAVVALLPPRPDSGAERSKGAPALFAVVKHADGRIVRVSGRDPLAAGDSLRFEISAPRGGFAAVVGLDQRPSVSAYSPASGMAVAVPRGRSFLEGSVLLDDAPGVERDVAVICDHPIAVEAVVKAAREALDRAHGDPTAVGALGLDGCREADVTFPKASR